nr:hypothetical protein NG677_03990 [Methylobacterium sp. OTU13CASTA1]
MPSPLDTIVEDIRLALKSGAYYSALSTSLTLPEVCACLAIPGGASTGQASAKYQAWYNANFAQKYPNLTALDCWCLRCGVLHQGRMGHGRMQYERVLFTLPNAQNNYFHNNIINDALNLDAVTFCEDIITTSLGWYVANKADPVVIQNVLLLVQMRPNGLAPYMVGMPLIS